LRDWTVGFSSWAGSTGGRERRARRRSDLQLGVVGDALDDRRCAIAAMIFSSLPQFGQCSRIRACQVDNDPTQTS
jgi:hypothetical protein